MIVFEFTHVGIELNGAANLLQGVHTWNAGVYEGAFYEWKYGVSTATSASFLYHVSRPFQLYTGPHAPCKMICVVPMHIGC